MPLRSALAHHADTRPTQIAVSIGGRDVSYEDLYVRSLKLDGFLAQLPRQDRDFPALQDVPLIAVHLGNHSAMPELLCAALAGSCCVMLLDPLLPDDRVQSILDRLPPDALFTATGAEIFDIAAPVYSLNSYKELDPLIHASKEPSTAPHPLSPFMVAFTSGTTSTPKAFARDRASWQRSLARGRVHFGTHADLSTLSPGPLVHGLSLYAFAETLEAGATFHTMEKFAANGAAALVADREIKRLVCVPTMLEALCQTAQDLPGLTQITSAGAKLSPELLARTGEFAENASVTEYYGASELGFVTTVTHTRRSTSGQSVGHPFPEVEIDIREPDATGNGTVWVKSDLVIQDYLWRDDARGFRRDSDWSTVGDIGHITDGALHLESRAGGMVTSGGNNIYLDEVATHLRSHPGITEVVVLGLPDSYLEIGRAHV